MKIEKIRRKLKPYKAMGLSEAELEYLATKYIGREHWCDQKMKPNFLKFLVI